MRALLGLAGFSVGKFWLGIGLLPAVNIFEAPLINLGDIDALPAVGGAVLVVWTFLGLTKATPLRFIPPAVVSFPLAAIGLFEIAQGYAERFI